MKAMVYYGANDIRFEEKPKAQIIEPGDAVVRMIKTTICGTDLGIWKGKNPEVAAGRILGHEGIGIVEEVGSAVKNIKKGDKVIVSCVSKCCSCDYCKEQMYSHCRNGGWILGYMIDGTQAEYVRTPYADNSLIVLPENVNEEVALLLSDALPTAHEIGVQYGDVRPGDTVFIAGAGPVGMSVLLAAQLYSPSAIIVCDMDENRLKLAKELGATHTVNPISDNVAEKVFEIAGKDGVDVAIEAVGVPATWDVCQDVVKAGGNIAVVGVHGTKVDFNLEKLWIKNLKITTGLVNSNTTEMLMRAIATSSVDYTKMMTHHFKFSELEQAYDVFKHAAEHNAMKVVLAFE
ncbi:zinc-dependent alcohol dehydrogenase family protein [Neisseria sp. ZJ106]|uniref:Zinc-dependent alcohol dehydrogenase family protein n=1 Tax=Neisseria lisongii TaxID=2912188 RepID=A0AAW5AC53_9NEIS|nr:zinc-dependent alcohol dehydrogenase family protein [Neisseria lisongii]MCF7520794.1 zinc-dependent alcohol dehydrogenase family protein [Neisseria lisongii]MCF7528899.1 zinc-dependent alcohol dehydrogenase family protein [Neisseria lisongii]WCL70731.1 zinc-dependent alcohol dehydrogenase family protein [Neisseria lisongii]